MEKSMVHCSVVGATSVTGGELIRLLAQHPSVRISCLTSRSEEQIYAKDLIPALGKRTDLVLEKYNLKKIVKTSDVVFLTLPHTLSAQTAGELYDAGKIVIDLSADFRLKWAGVYEDWYHHRHERKDLLKKAVYGLPEVYRSKIKRSHLIANPGCYPTSILLPLAPLFQENLVERDSIVVDSKSGVSGAGKNLSLATQFIQVSENFGAYKVGCHQHTPEVEQVLSDVAGENIQITFVPHLLPVNRGILSTIYLKRRKKTKKAQFNKVFRQFDSKEPFIRYLGLGQFPTLQRVQYTNFCDIGVFVEDRSDRVIVISAIDNLMKGAGGQAIQNLNIRMNFPEQEGLAQ
jgi:N-acetyl-gamma-glutamyl-phosphate reductase